MFRDYNVFNTTWEEYKKTPFNKRTKYSGNRNKRIKLFKISHKEKPDFILDISDVETYLKTYLIYNLYKIGEKYDYVALIKTDAIWCENNSNINRVWEKCNEESSLLYAHLKRKFNRI